MVAGADAVSSIKEVLKGGEREAGQAIHVHLFGGQPGGSADAVVVTVIHVRQA